MDVIIEFFSNISPVKGAFYATVFTWLLTAFGASFVFLFKTMQRGFLDGMLGFTGGVMVAASFWSLLAPGIEMSPGEGFVKVIYDAKYGEFLGCHIIGHDATELIAEAVTARELETTYHEIIEAIHPHPTLSEAVMEASRAAIGEPLNI